MPPESPPELPVAPWPHAWPPRAVDLVLSADGSVLSLAPGAAEWVSDPAVLQRLTGEVTARGAGWWRLPPLTIRCVQLHGPGGPQLLVTVIPPRPEIAEALERLTPTQVVVAEYAAAGATIREIAEALNRAPETVRSHLKTVYRLMWVSNRVELAHALRRAAISHGA